MKFVNIRTTISALLVATGLVGCATTGKSNQASSPQPRPERVRVLDTSEYIPQREVAKETGLLLPYQAANNPYTSLTGRLDSQAVSIFVNARKAYRNGHFIKAKTLLKPLVDNNQELSGPHVLMGDVAQAQKQYDLAIEAYEKAISINRNNINAYIRLAKVQRIKGQFLPAQNTYAKALSVWKDFPEAHLNLAVLYDLYLNKPLKAQRHLEAYHFLTQGRDKKRNAWLTELMQRTGKSIALELETDNAATAKANPASI
ncbi:M48 family metallopeptidase [Pleionea sp. CnH1-48]|uniref:tetratricopeptide repeat protein n=1 Tax=Pleionea sp. CnH1-48 TaxID=2954494 RepID=UPI002097FE95|nr:tetratricopeptide repeat protein [Pleionea sp. CnH1-48]MCO7223235.1 tetratricopeptide repeat protein [Pleionea sp. CnH1-48]